MAVTINGTTGIDTPSLTADTTTLVVDETNNRVGIGTSSPSAPLHIYSASANRPLIESNSTSQAGLILKNTDREFRILNGSSSLSVYDQTSGSERMRIDSAGRVTMPYQPAFTVSGNNIGWSASLSSGHILELGNVSSYNVFDRGNNYDASNYRFVAPIDGVYLFAANLYGLLSNTEQGYNFTINGTATRGHSSFTIYGAEDATGDLVVNGTALFELSANDWVDIRVNTNGTTWYAPHSWWSGYLVG